MTEIVLQLRALPDPVGVESRIGADLARTGLRLQRQHPGTSDPVLARWYSVVVPGDMDAEVVAGSLRVRIEVEAAYVKPAAATP